LFAGFPTKTLYAPPLSHTCYMTRQSYSSSYDHTNNIWRGVQIMKVFIMQPAPLPCYIVLPRPKYRPRNPIPSHPPHMFLPQCDRPSSTPIYSIHQSVPVCYASSPSFSKVCTIFPFDFATYISSCTKHC